MDIHNPTEFRNFINSNGMLALHGDFQALDNCLMEYERGCDCANGNERQQIYNKCKAIYQRSVNAAPGFKAHFMTHTRDMSILFYLDGQLIGSVRR